MKSGSNSPAFRKKKGYYQHIIDVQRLNSKKNLKFYLRDGNRHLQKADNDNEWYVKDKNEHDCHHHFMKCSSIEIPSLPMESLDSKNMKKSRPKKALEQKTSDEDKRKIFYEL